MVQKCRWLCRQPPRLKKPQCRASRLLDLQPPLPPQRPHRRGPDGRQRCRRHLETRPHGRHHHCSTHLHAPPSSPLAAAPPQRPPANPAPPACRDVT
eukprot:297695-Chlamydomonas_euryale.AAC.1